MCPVRIMSSHFKKGETVTKEVYLRVLIDVVKPWMETVASQKAICFSTEQCTGSYESFDSKLALGQHRYVLVQGILALPTAQI